MAHGGHAVVAGQFYDTVFVGAWQSSELAGLLGPNRLFLAAALAATLVTWFTFLPSFVFILAGARWSRPTKTSWPIPAR